jgi:hypothetical protein
MRGMFGLVALLVGVAILVYVWSSYNIPVAHEGQKAKAEAEQISGYDPAGDAVKDTIRLEPVANNGKPSGAVITFIKPGSVMEQHYGLKVNDVIVAVGALTAAEDPEMVRALEAYQRQEPITILRGGVKYEMPKDARAAAIAAAGGSTGATPSATGGVTNAPQTPEPSSPSPAPAGSSLQRQLDSIKVPTH